VTAEARHIARMTRAADPAADDPTKVVATDTPALRADAGMAWGPLLHGLLEHAMRHPSATREDLRRLAMWLTVEEPSLRDVLTEAVDTATSVARAGFWDDAQTAEHNVEAPFTTVSSDAVPSVSTGVIDLMFAGSSGWRVIDYKTDSNQHASVPMQYVNQLKAYELALERCGTPVEGSAIQFVRPGIGPGRPPRAAG
jgi:ATP-dependent exoDNAse (exonuclease V) beta subunit